MSARATPNYPDILGAITGGPRCNINVVQLALAVRPRVVRAGRPFEAILLVQNASDVDVDVTATLRLPDKDAAKQKNQFASHHTRLLVGLHPAEVGYVTLPVACATTTAVHEGYKLGMDVQVKPLGKAQRIRQPQGGGEACNLREDLQAQIADLDKLHFSADKQFGLTDTLEALFGVLPGRLGHIVDTRPDWVSLWTMADHEDHGDLFAAYAPMLGEHVLPSLKPDHVIGPLQEVTEAYFERAGYPLQPIETLFIAKMLARVLQLSNPVDDLADFQADHCYNVLRMVKETTEGSRKPSDCELPYWCRGFVKVVATSKDALYHPAQVISQMLYLDLVRDAVPLAIELVQRETGADLGTPDEAGEYAGQLVTQFEAGSGVNFDHAYMPLILGGVLVGHRVAGRREHLDEEVRDLRAALDARAAEQTEQNAPIFQIAQSLLEKSGRQYTFMP